MSAPVAPSAPAPAPATRLRAAGPALAFTACSLIWGSTFLFISIGNDSLAPVWAAGLRLLLAALILGALAARAGGLPRGAALRTAMVYGLLQFGVNLPLLYWGELAVPSGLSAVLYATVPLTGAIFARMLGLERLHALKLGGALLGLGGVALLFAGELRGAIPAAPLAALAAAVLCASFSTVLVKRGPRQSPLGLNAVGCMVGAPCCLLASAVLGERHMLPLTPGSLGPLLYLTLAGSVTAFVLMTWLVNQWPVSRVGFIGVVAPVVAMTLGHSVRGERFAPGALAGTALVIAGVLSAIAGDRRDRRRRTVVAPRATDGPPDGGAARSGPG